MSPRWLSVAAHFSPFPIVIAAAVLAGGPRGWIAALIPLGPLLFGLHPGVRDERVAAHRSDALVFSSVIACYLLLAWGVIAYGVGTSIAGFIVPPALLVLMLVALNWILFAAIAARRAATDRRLDYPMVPGVVRRLAPVPRTSEGAPHGNR